MKFSVESSVAETCKAIREQDQYTWAIFDYKDDNTVGLGSTGVDYEEFLDNFSNDRRLYAYVHFKTGDEMSVRSKFVFISWIGQEVSAMKKGVVSMHRAQVRQAVENSSVDVQAISKDEIKKPVIEALLKKAGGADYGKGQ